jgi:hypothetical protein
MSKGSARMGTTGEVQTAGTRAGETVRRKQWEEGTAVRKSVAEGKSGDWGRRKGGSCKIIRKYIRVYTHTHTELGPYFVTFLQTEYEALFIQTRYQLQTREVCHLEFTSDNFTHSLWLSNNFLPTTT